MNTFAYFENQLIGPLGATFGHLGLCMNTPSRSGLDSSGREQLEV